MKGIRKPMEILNFDKPIAVHFIGIGGISMSGLAQILLNRGFIISGSDMNKTELTIQLEHKGAKIYYEHSKENISDEIQLVVYTAAISEDNEELKAAREKNCPIISRAQLLGLLMDNYREAIAVSGTHGKTTTTSMLAEVLINNKIDPTITVGGMLDFIGGNLRIGKGEVFLTEACEYMNSFLEFKPSLEVILNVEEDHLDFFKDLDDIRSSFHKFGSVVREGGIIVINSCIPNYKELVKGIDAKIVSFGRGSSSDYYARNITLDQSACAGFDLYFKDKRLAHVQLSVPGEYNVDNALATVASGLELGMSLELTLEALSNFEGTHRRFERKGVVNGILVVDDYAHHPTEIKAAIKTARQCEHNELWLAFQPHTYTRTHALFDEFVSALSQADHVILADIYAAREKNTIGISSRQLVAALKEKNVDAYYIDSFEEIENFALKKCKKNDMFITMGAGNIVEVSNSLVRGRTY